MFHFPFFIFVVLCQKCQVFTIPSVAVVKTKAKETPFDGSQVLHVRIFFCRERTLPSVKRARIYWFWEGCKSNFAVFMVYKFAVKGGTCCDDAQGHHKLNNS